MNDVRKVIYGTLIGFFMVLGLWFSIIYVSACGFTFTCNQGKPKVYRTPIPTLLPATLPPQTTGGEPVAFDKCQIAAVDLLGAWVSANSPETETFQFTDVNGQTCEGAFEKDIKPLFTESNLWYPGSISCTSCHNSDLAKSPQNMDLSSYKAIIAGAGRANNEPQGTDILGGGTWEDSILYKMIQGQGNDPFILLGQKLNMPERGPLVYAGKTLLATELLETTATPKP
jgi:hypothetical protein